MPITLQEAKVTMVDPVDQLVIDEFRRGSWLLDQLTFDNAVAPATGGSTLVYGYTKLLTPSGAQTRAINGEYTPSEAKKTRENAYLQILGGNFKLDRVIINTAGSVDELGFQMKQKIKAASNLFNWLAINGDSDEGTDAAPQFDGLAKLLEGSDTVVTATVDISTSALMDSNYNAFLDEVNEWLAKLEEKPAALLMNSKMLTKMKNIARRAGYYSRGEDAFGRTVDQYDNIPMIDLQEYYDAAAETPSNKLCVPIEADGTTAIYAICTGLDGFHGVSPQGNKIIDQHLPDLNAPGVLKEGDVEIVCAVALKNTHKAGCLKGIKVQETESL